MTIYAAVIEWPDSAEPSLILAHSERERDAQIAAEIRSAAHDLLEPDWRNVVNVNPGDNWQDWLDRLDSTAYGQPFVALYERDM